MTLTAPALWRRLAAACLALSLAACGGGGNDHDHTNTFIDTAGRLALAENGSPILRIHDLDSSSVAGSFTLANPPSAVYASPGRRFAIAVQRTQDRVEFIDGGIWQEDHGDHLHDYKQAPRMAALTLTGPQPTHYDDRGAQASIFMDGRSTTTTQQVSAAALFSDDSILRGTVLASLTLGTAMHGFAEPNGQHLVVTHREPGGVDTLPNRLELWRRAGSGFSFVQRFATPCDGMHGSYTRAGVTVAGCNDGVLMVHPVGTASFAATKIGADRRISTIAGHPKAAQMVGIGNAGQPSTTHFYDIDPAAGRATAFTPAGWSEGRLRRAHAFDRHGRLLFVLDDQGTLRALQRGASGWSTVRTLPGVIAVMPAAAPFPALAANGARDEVYLTDPNGRQLIVIDTARLEVSRRVALGFAPSAVAWLGIER